MPPNVPDGEPLADLTVPFVDDAAFAAVVDLGSYPSDLPDWDFDTLTAKVVDAAAAGQLVAWGHPEQQLNVRLTTSPPPPGAKATATGSLVVTGPVAFAGYTAITMAAQFDDHGVERDAHAVVHLAPQRYRVDVHRYIDHEPGDQWSDDADDHPDLDHYVVSFTPDPEPVAAHPDIPWALPPI